MNETRFTNTISIRRFGFALGAVSALLYLGCVFVMLAVPQPAVIAFFNSLLHGWNVEPLMRWDMPWWEACVGMVEIFILGWLVGAAVAMFYNLAGAKGVNHTRRQHSRPRQLGHRRPGARRHALLTSLVVCATGAAGLIRITRTGL